MLGIILDPSIYSYPFAPKKKKKKIPLLCQKPTSATPVFKWWGEGLKPRTTGTCLLLLDLPIPGYRDSGLRQSRTQPPWANCLLLCPTNCRDTQVTQQKRACCPSHGREPPAFAVFMYPSLPPLVCRGITPRGGRGHCLTPVRRHAPRWALSPSCLTRTPPKLPLFAPPAEAPQTSHLHTEVKRGPSQSLTVGRP